MSVLAMRLRLSPASRLKPEMVHRRAGYHPSPTTTPWRTRMLNPAPDDDYDAVDMDALKRAMDIAARDPATAQQLKSKLESGVPGRLLRNLRRTTARLGRWGSRRGKARRATMIGRESTALLDEMLEAGISQFERIRSGRWPRPRSGADDRHCPRARRAPVTP